MPLIEIDGAFSKGIIDAKGRNKIPAYFSGYVRNARIRNEAITNRRWPLSITSLWDTPIRQLHWNDTELLAIAWWLLYRITPWPAAAIWVVGTATQQYQMISQGKYTIILTGTSAPFVYSRATWLFASDVTGAGPNSWPNTLPYGNTADPGIQNPQPLIWASITGFTFIAGNQTSNNHILYISKPVLPEVPENSYNWSQIVSSINGWQLDDQQSYDVGRNRHMTSEILALANNLENVYIFCRESIEMISRNNVETFGSYINLATIPIGDGDQIAGVDSACTAGDKVFFITNSLQIKTIWYESWVAYPIIGNLSDRKGQEIRQFMRENLDDDQSHSVAFFNKEQNIIEFHMRSRDSNYENDITLIYDLVHQTFLVDNNKKYSCMTRWGSAGLRLYAWDFLTGQIYLDYSETSDDLSGGANEPTPFERNSPNIALGNPAKEKQFRGFTLSWAMNSNTTIVITCYIDGREEFTKTIDHDDIYPTEDQAGNIWWSDDGQGWLSSFQPFEYVADQWMLRKKGKRIRIKVTAQTGGMEFYLDSLAIDAVATGEFELNDKF